METINLGKVSIVYRGDYSEIITYNKMDVVFDGYSSYISKVASNTGNSLSDTNYWGYVAKGQQILSGPTENRPTIVSIGIQYFDTTLSKPIWYNGASWVDSNGLIV